MPTRRFELRMKGYRSLLYYIVIDIYIVLNIVSFILDQTVVAQKKLFLLEKLQHFVD